MKQKTFLVAAGCLALSVATVGAQSTPQKSADSPEMRFLRRLIAEQQKNPDKIVRTLPPTNSPALNRPQPAAAPAKIATPVPATPASDKTITAPITVPTSAEAARQQKIFEVETRLDEMLRQKAAREKAALTNAAPVSNTIPATPQTKRQRLDALLKQMIDGKIAGAEYTEKREKIVAEPD